LTEGLHVFILSTISLGGKISYSQLVLWKDNFLSMDVLGFNSERMKATTFVRDGEGGHFGWWPHNVGTKAQPLL